MRTLTLLVALVVTTSGCAHTMLTVADRVEQEPLPVVASAAVPSPGLQRAGAPRAIVALGVVGGALAAGLAPLALCGTILGPFCLIAADELLMLGAAVAPIGALVGGIRAAHDVKADLATNDGARRALAVAAHDRLDAPLLAGALGSEVAGPFGLHAGESPRGGRALTLRVTAVSLIRETRQFRPSVTVRAAIVGADGRERGSEESSRLGAAALWQGELPAELKRLAREASASAVSRLLSSLPPSAKSAYGSELCGLGPVTVDGRFGVAGFGATGSSVRIDPDQRVLAWEPWIPPAESGVRPEEVTYDLNVRRVDGDEAPVLDLRGLQLPRQTLPAELAGQTPWSWSVRAVVERGGRRFATDWSHFAGASGCKDEEHSRTQLFRLHIRAAPPAAPVEQAEADGQEAT